MQTQGWGKADGQTLERAAAERGLRGLLPLPRTSTRGKMKDQCSRSTKQALGQTLLKHKTCSRASLTPIKKTDRTWHQSPSEVLFTLNKQLYIWHWSSHENYVKLGKAFGNRKQKLNFFKLPLGGYGYTFSRTIWRNNSLNTEDSFEYCEEGAICSAVNSSQWNIIIPIKSFGLVRRNFFLTLNIRS